MLYDRVTIEVQAGGGGNGCVSFRREAHVPRGGPDGGDGGRGGDVVLVADANLRDLAAFRGKRHHPAQRGGHGSGAQRHGAAGEDLVLAVPAGTVVEDAEQGVTHDLRRDGQRAVVARGGSGGRGNRRFATSTRQAPRFAEQGLLGRRGDARAASQAARRRGDRGRSQRRQVLAPAAAHPGAAEGRRLPLHDARAGPGHGRGPGGPPAGARRHPRADRRCRGRGRARTRVPRPRRADAPAGPSGRHRATRRRRSLG